MTGERRHVRSSLLGAVYGRATQARRRWYARRADRRRRLDHPVVSVGNLVVGGSGKTPIVAAIARMLRDRGERPVVLTRGYGRRDHVEGVRVVSDGHQILEPVSRSGDEPQLLARTLAGIPILVSADRYVAGRFAERHFDVSVFILDDGFQHVQLEREVDLVVVSPGDLGERLLPWGCLREPLGTARVADALLVSGVEDQVIPVARAFGHDGAFRVESHYSEIRIRTSGQVDNEEGTPVDKGRALAVAGIARPQRFFDALRALGWDVAGELIFRDHHWFTPRDVEKIQRAAQQCDASIIVTTEKDAVRLPSATGGIPFAVLPMTVAIEPADVFASWLLDRLRTRSFATVPVRGVSRV